MACSTLPADPIDHKYIYTLYIERGREREMGAINNQYIYTAAKSHTQTLYFSKNKKKGADIFQS